MISPAAFSSSRYSMASVLGGIDDDSARRGPSPCFSTMPRTSA